MDASQTTDDVLCCKYDPSILQNTLHEHLQRIVNQIEPQKKHSFLINLSSSLNVILSCFKCKSLLGENSSSFNCGHKYCEQCIKHLKKCSSCNEGSIRTNIRNFSSILNIVNEIKSNFNTDKVIYEMMRYLLMPQKFPYIEEAVQNCETNIECTPRDTSLVEKVDQRKSRKSTANDRKRDITPNALKNSRKKLEFNKETKSRKNSTNSKAGECNSESSFFAANTVEEKISEKKSSYLEQQPTISEITSIYTPVSDTKRKRKNSDSESSDQNSKSKRAKMKNNLLNSLTVDEKLEPNRSRKTTPKLKMKSPQRSSESTPQGIFSGFDYRELVECFNKLEVLLNCHDAECRAHDSKSSKKSSNNIDVLSATGKEKQNSFEVKTNLIFNSIKSTVDEKKKLVISERDIDTEVLDPDIWKRNDKYEKKKNLFKSVKERNKRNISIGGNLGNLLEPRKLTPKKQWLSRSENNTNENVEAMKDTEINFSKNKTKLDEDFGLVFSENQKMSKTDKVSEKEVSKVPSTNKQTGKDLDISIVLQKITPKKQLPVELKNNSIASTEMEDAEILFSTDEKIFQEESNLMKSEVQKNSKIGEVFEDVAPITSNLNNCDEIELPNIVDMKSNVLDQSKEKPSKNEEGDDNLISETEPKKISREVLAEITDHQQNSKNVENSTEKHTTPLPASKSFTPSRTGGKLGLPLFSETNSDIFSQKGQLSSSTPCVAMTKKVTKTYTRTKNNLFNKSFPETSPIPEENNYDDILTFPDISPIAEKQERNNNYEEETLFDDTHSPKYAESHEKIPATEDSAKMEAKSTHLTVVAEIHEVPDSPSNHVAKELPQSKDYTLPMQCALSKNPVENNLHSDEIIPMEVDAVAEAVEKVAENILSKTSKSSIDSEDRTLPVDSNAERENKINKMKKLQESINIKTEKTLMNLKKNFNKSTARLSVEKVKNHTSSTTPAKNSSHFTPTKSSPPTDQNNRTVLSSPVNKRISGYDGDVPTQKRCTPTKSVACQTSPELHLALLKQEFPHLFEKYTNDSAKKDYAASVYDTPAEPINQGVKITAKTPDVGLLNTTAKYTLVSSVTSSEKKLIDEQFMNESVLGNTSYNVINANKTVDISDYNPLSPETQNTRKKLSCRLNFDDDEETERKLAEVPLLNDTELDEDTAIKNAPGFSINRSNEIDFSDGAIDKKDEEVFLSASILESIETSIKIPAKVNQSKIDDENMNKTFYESDPSATPVSSAARQVVSSDKKDADSTVMAIPDTDNMDEPNDDKNEVVTDDDDDIEFIPGTPTSQPKRTIGNNLEKIRTPLSFLRKAPDISLQEFSIVGNTTPNTSSIQPLADVSQYSVVKKPTAAEVTPIEEPAKKDDFRKVSLELFNSSVSILSSTSDKILIAASGLKEPDLKLITKFCDKFSTTYVDKLTDKCTHLVVKTNHKNRTARTFKYLQAIVSQIRIVSIKWIQECLTQDKIVQEEKYIPLDSSGECGPLRTYHVIKGVTPSPLSWLSEYCIYFMEPVPQECTLQQLQLIMQKAGAVVVNNLREFKMYPKHHHIIVISDDEDCDDEYTTKIAGWLQSYEAVSVEFNWILEVIGRNRLMPFADFEVMEIPNEYLLQRNFPPVMLQSNDEDLNSSD